MFLVCCQQSYLPLESLRARQHIDQCLPLFDKPHSAWPSSPTLNSSPRNQAGKVLTPHSPHLSPLASLEGWELAKARISRALCYNPVFRGPCVFGVGKGFDWWVFHLPGSSTDLSGLGNLINLAPATLDVCADEVVAGTWLRLLVAEELPGERLFFLYFLVRNSKEGCSLLACSAGWTCGGLLACKAAETNPPAHWQTRDRGLWKQTWAFVSSWAQLQFNG